MTITCTSSQTLTNKSNKNEVLGFVQLNNNGPNLVSVFNMCTYSLFKIYRKDDSLSEYYEHATIRAGNPIMRGEQCQLVVFEDLANSSTKNKYKICPIQKGIELDTLSVTYAFKDSLNNK